MNKLKGLIVSMRPKQWLKNCFVFAGLVFSGSFVNAIPVLRAVCAFVLFSLVSGSAYIINDIIDREKDSVHPKKRMRPIASGLVCVRGACLFSLAVLIISLGAACFLSPGTAIILAAYFFLTMAYSLVLKNIVILDVIIIAAGFVLRTVAGAVAIDVWISPWLLLCTTMLALFLALNKRKNEIIVLSDNAENHRKNLGQYSPALIDSMLSVITSTTVMSYSLYTFSAGKSNYMMLTIPFVLYGIFRYQYLASEKDMGGDPGQALLKDRPLQIDILLWIVACMVIVIFFQ